MRARRIGHGRMRTLGVLLVVALAWCGSAVVSGAGDPAGGVGAASEPRSRPIAVDADAPASEYTKRESLYIEDVVFGTDAGGFHRASACPLDVSLVWSHPLSTGVYASSVIAHIFPDVAHGQQVVVPGFHREINILDHDGHHVSGSPVTMPIESYFHTAPLLTDFNHDGAQDIVWVNVDGQILVINPDGDAEEKIMDGPWSLPKLKLRKRWYADTDAVPKPTTHRTTQTTPTPTHSTRRLMSVPDENPLGVLRREKVKQHAIRRFVDRVRTIRAGRTDPAQLNQPAAANSARRLMQVRDANNAVNNRDDDEEDQEDEDDEEAESTTDEEEPTPVVDAAAARTYLNTLRSQTGTTGNSARGSTPPTDDDDRRLMRDLGLQMPSTPDGEVVDDQEEDPDSDADDTRLEGGTRPGNSSPEPALEEEYTSPEIQAALDELLAEDPSFLQSVGMDGVKRSDGSVDYTDAMRELAARYAAEQREIARRRDAADADTMPTHVRTDDPATVKEVNEHVRANLERILSANEAAAQTTSPLEPGTSQVDDGLPEEARESLGLFSNLPSSLSDLDPEVAWQIAELDRLYPVRPDDVWVDAHVLATPVIADITGDGQPELILSVSYFFDETDYDARPELRSRLGHDVDLHKYVAGCLVVVDMWTHQLIWQEHLDLTTNDVDLKAHIYATPTVVDLDADGTPEIIVATGVGLIYAFNSATHNLQPGFPIAMSEIQAQVAVGDVNQDGRLELVAMDAKGNVLCFDMHGKEVWSTLISGFASQSATFGDINGDGQMDVVIGTVSGHVWALNGIDGQVLPHFPLRTDGRIIAPITLVHLDTGSYSRLSAPSGPRGLHLVFPSFDGHVYLVDGRSGCTNKIDIGEHSYGMVLVDDVLGRGKLDLIVTTMSGNVFCFATEADNDRTTINTWSSQTQGANGFTARHDYHGIYLTRESRARLGEIQGATFDVEYVIVDERAKRTTAATSAAAAPLVAPRYDVEFRFAGVRVAHVTHTSPGRYVQTLAAPTVPQYTTIELHLRNEHHQTFQDQVAAGINVHFYRHIKYLVVFPFFVFSALMLWVKSAQPELPV